VTTRRSRQQQSEDLFVTVTVVIEGCGVSRVTVSKNLWNGTIVLPQAVFCVMCYAPRRGERGLMLQLCATRAEGIACSAQQAELVIDQSLSHGIQYSTPRSIPSRPILLMSLWLAQNVRPTLSVDTFQLT
jgi:hypothetical protein